MSLTRTIKKSVAIFLLDLPGFRLRAPWRPWWLAALLSGLGGRLYQLPVEYGKKDENLSELRSILPVSQEDMDPVHKGSSWAQKIVPREQYGPTINNIVMLGVT